MKHKVELSNSQYFNDEKPAEYLSYQSVVPVCLDCCNVFPSQSTWVNPEFLKQYQLLQGSRLTETVKHIEGKILT